MCSIPDRPALRPAGPRALLAVILALCALSGCQHRGRPFEDVATRDARQPTMPDAPGDESSTAEGPTMAFPPQAPSTSMAGTEPATQPTIALQVMPDGARRIWPQNVVHRANGDTPAGLTYAPTAEKAAGRSDLHNVFIEPGEFLLNAVLFPVRAVRTPPWKMTTLYSQVNEPRP